MKQEVSIEEALKRDGLLVCTTAGWSMYPMLRDRRDTIIVKPAKERLNKYDVALYKRGGRYVLHRVIRVLPDSYVICGDNSLQKEKGIRDEQILGVLTGFYRGKKRINMEGMAYRLYSRTWGMTRPVRRVVIRMKEIVRRGPKWKES